LLCGPDVFFYTSTAINIGDLTTIMMMKMMMMMVMTIFCLFQNIR
jgi:hypothetical protein